MGQVVQFYLDKEVRKVEGLHVRMNRLLPPDLRVIRLHATPAHFSVRHHAIAREYHYNLTWGEVQMPLHRRYYAHVRGDLDVDAMEEALGAFIGTHDFVAFSNFLTCDTTDSVRTILKARIVLESDHLRIEIKGTGFLRKMMRHIVGALIAVGKKKISCEYIQSLLDGGWPDTFDKGHHRGWTVADACGLHKVHVEYPDGYLL
jgi:tRNA pseudouridine38-40 synthase